MENRLGVSKGRDGVKGEGVTIKNSPRKVL